MMYRTFRIGLLADYDKALGEIWRFSMHFSAKVAKIGGTKFLEEIQYSQKIYKR